MLISSTISLSINILYGLSFPKENTSIINPLFETSPGLHTKSTLSKFKCSTFSKKLSILNFCPFLTLIIFKPKSFFEIIFSKIAPGYVIIDVFRLSHNFFKADDLSRITSLLPFFMASEDGKIRKLFF